MILDKGIDRIPTYITGWHNFKGIFKKYCGKSISS